MSQITLTFPDGNSRDVPAGITPGEVAADISKSLSKKAISATVNGAHFDLAWPIEADASIAINTMADDDPALELIRHDLAHVMARAVQAIWPDVKVTIGPVRDYGWFYDFDREEPFTPDDLGAIEAEMKKIINARDPVRTEVWPREKARQHYVDTNEPYKVELLDRIPGDEPIRMYWHGDWQDLCRGPHLQHTGQIPADAFKLTRVSSAYWLGDNTRPQLQRIYGIAFRNREDLKKHLQFLEEAEARDHRRLGREMDLYHMQEEAPGQVFWHPNGWTIYTALQDFVRRDGEVVGCDGFSSRVARRGARWLSRHQPGYFGRAGGTGGPRPRPSGDAAATEQCLRHRSEPSGRAGGIIWRDAGIRVQHVRPIGDARRSADDVRRAGE